MATATFNDRMDAMWEERFAQEGYLFGTEPVPFLLKHDKHFAKGGTGHQVGAWWD